MSHSRVCAGLSLCRRWIACLTVYVEALSTAAAPQSSRWRLKPSSTSSTSVNTQAAFMYRFYTFFPPRFDIFELHLKVFFWHHHNRFPQILSFLPGDVGFIDEHSSMFISTDTSHSLPPFPSPDLGTQPLPERISMTDIKKLQTLYRSHCEVRLISAQSFLVHSCMCFLIIIESFF